GWIETLTAVATQVRTVDAGRSRTPAEERLDELRNQAGTIMDAIQAGLRGKARETALRRYQDLWDEVERLDAEQPMSRVGARETIEIRYDRSVVEDFVRHLPAALRANVEQGREFLHETLRSVRIREEGRRARACPLCRAVLGKLTPQHLALHGLTL